MIAKNSVAWYKGRSKESIALWSLKFTRASSVSQFQQWRKSAIKGEGINYEICNAAQGSLKRLPRSPNDWQRPPIYQTGNCRLVYVFRVVSISIIIISLAWSLTPSSLTPPENHPIAVALREFESRVSGK